MIAIGLASWLKPAPENGRVPRYVETGVCAARGGGSPAVRSRVRAAEEPDHVLVEEAL